jgi:UDP-N-acetylglucosamine:LPS N-acetylglucosamine transferase
METKHIVILGLIAAFFLGAGTSGLTSKAFTSPRADAIEAPYATTQPVARRTSAVASPAVRNVAVNREPAPAVQKQNKRSVQKEVLIVGGSAGAGAAIGAVAGGKKGAAIGAVSGGVAGLIYDLATRNK